MKAVLLVNVGTPDKPDIKHVGKFLFQFLNDPEVIDIPWFLRILLVNFFIIPFHILKSKQNYNELWDQKGSPLLYHLMSMETKLQQKLGKEYKIVAAMRYGNPSLRNALQILLNDHYDEIIVLPLFPQFASSTTGSIINWINKELSRYETYPNIRLVKYFYHHPLFLEAFVKRIQFYNPQHFDHVIFSYHGLPVSHIQSIHPEKEVFTCNCTSEFPPNGDLCYKASCYHTTRLLAKGLNIKEENYSTSFQSQMGKNWLRPFTGEILESLLKMGKKKVLIVTPSFVSDCLETLVEINKEMKNKFIHSGGEELVLVESLNDSDDWIDALSGILTQN